MLQVPTIWKAMHAKNKIAYFTALDFIVPMLVLAPFD
jgi:hypothetical protein